MPLREIKHGENGILLDLKYATNDNVTGKPIYKEARCYVLKEAHESLCLASQLAQTHGLHLKIFDAYRPGEAQQILWDFCPDENYVMPPHKGSLHTRGIALDLTLVDDKAQELDMGTAFDDFTEQSHHNAPGLSKTAARNRTLLAGIMHLAGFEKIRTEWWHYQLPQGTIYPLITTQDFNHGMI